MGKRGISDYRNVLITFTDNGSDLLPIDAHKAAIALVEDMESRYASLGATGQPDLTAEVVLARGTLPQKIHFFTVTSVMANGTYTFAYDETRPNPN